MRAEYDLIMIGSGLASSQTLRALLTELLSTPPERTLRVAMLEQGPDFFGGVAYGARSAPTARVITPLEEFLDDAERAGFIAWIETNADQLLDELIELGRVQTTRWAQERRSGAVDWEAQYVPRCWYGQFLTEQMTAIIAEADQADVATVDLIRTSVHAVERKGDFEVVTTEGPLRAARVVLGIGSVGAREGVYSRSMQDTIEGIIANAGSTITIVGANATMLDLLYQLEDDPRIAAAKPDYRIVSRRGILPAAHEGALPLDTPLPHLDALQDASGLRACVIEQAVRAELERSRGDGGRLIPAVGARLGPLLDLLPKAEKEVFANDTGVEIGRLQRRAGGDYRGVLEALTNAGRLELVPESVRPDEIGSGPHDTAIDASGFGAMEPGQNPLIDSLIGNQLARTTACQRGLVVSDSLEASPGLFVVGPLLAGNVLDGRPMWHLEHAGRIIAMACELGVELGRAGETTLSKRSQQP